MLDTTAIGRLGNDAEVIKIGDAQAIKFSLAHSESYKKDDKWVEKTVWVNCIKYGDKTEVAKHLKKGVRVFVSGTPSARAYTNKAGEVIGTLELKVLKMDILFEAQAEGAISAKPSSIAPKDTEDDMPF